MLRLQSKNKKMQVVFDEVNGDTIGIYDTTDSYHMNWILENSRWGLLGDYKTEEIERISDGIRVTFNNEEKGIKVEVEKRLLEECYEEHYCLINVSGATVVIQKEDVELNGYNYFKTL